ncbi:MAG TPA: imidazoleglycerol-phosphate dehydratase HisB [Dehalococcoidales bacterium]|nr:imidazoleglycerol-phosphate dehydratase HisB [Dehalococcoidales bacterium]
MESAEEVLKKIIRLQESNAYSDQQMAEKIGCSRPLYQRTRTGKIPVGGTFLKGAMKLLGAAGDGGRKASVRRQTRETSIELELNVDGHGAGSMDTGIGFFDHLLDQLARHGLFDIKLKATGDDPHHIVEDVAICLGKAFNEALGEKRGIRRMASVAVPMDEALVTVTIDIGGRGYAVLDLTFSAGGLTGLNPDLVRHFLESFAFQARLNLHAAIVYGSNDHHKAEALFKALGRALDAATRIDERISGELPTTKGFLEK